MKKIILFAFLVLIGNTAFSQLDTIISYCNQYIKYPYISDGQQYRAILTKGQTAEFNVTFYGNATYRIIVATAPHDRSVVFRLYDKNKNELFSNEDFNNSTYWDFKFESTVNCSIEAELPEGKNSGFVIMFIAFKGE